MPEFPVQRFTGQLAVTAPSVRFATDAGEQYDAAAIKSISNMLVEIDQIQGKAELSTMRRRYQEDSFTAFNEYSKTGDPEQRQAIIQAWQDRANSIQSKRGWVNQEFQTYLDNVQPYWQQNFMSQEVKHQVATVDDETSINFANALQFGDTEAAKTSLSQRLEMGLMTQPEYEQAVTDLPVSMGLAQARQMIGNNKAVEARKTLQGLTGLSGKQLDQRDNLLRMADSQLSENGDAFGKQMLADLLKAKSLPPAQREAVAEQMKNMAVDPNNGLSLEQSRVMINYIDDQLYGGATKTDWKAYEKVRKAIDSIDTPDSAQEARDLFYQEAPNLAESEQEELLKLLLDAEAGDKTNTEYISDLNRLGTIGVFTPSEAKIKSMLSEGEWNTYSKLDKAGKDAYAESLGIQRKREVIDEFIAYQKEAGPLTPEQKRKWIEEKTKLDKTEKTKGFFAKLLGWGKDDMDYTGFGVPVGGEKRPEPVKLTASNPDHVKIAQKYLQMSLGNVERAQQMAREDGFEW